MLPRVPKGKRALILGRTGSGKTAGAVWLLSRSPGKFFVLNAKHDELMTKIGPQVELDRASILEGLKKSRVVVCNPKTTSQESFDDLIGELGETTKNLGFCCDELLYLHKGNGQAGPGLLGWLTRGRSRGQSFIGATQRPAMISQFCYSEADYYMVYHVPLRKDQLKIDDFSRRGVSRDRGPYQWGWYDVGADKLQEYGPVPFAGLDKRFRQA